MHTITEVLNGGLVTSRHPALLNPGELQRADDCVYREKDPAIWRAPGRLGLNATVLGAPSAVKGLIHNSYERARTDQLIAYSGTTLQRSDLKSTTPPTIDALSFTEIGGPGQIPGTVSTLTTFTATTGFPFLADIVGANVGGSGVTGIFVQAVSNQSGSTGHYSTITVSGNLSNGAATLTFDYGCVVALSDVGDEILDSVQFGTAYFAWFGRGGPRRLSWRGRRTISGTALDDTMVARPIGLDAVRTAPTITTATNATYSWNSTLGAGYYWFLITEIFAPGGDVTGAEKDANLRNEIVESAYLADTSALDPNGAAGRPIPVNITVMSGVGAGVRIVFPAVTNNGVTGRIANCWAIYMYGPTTDGTTAPSLALLRRVAVIRMTQYTAGYTFDLYQSTLAPQTAFAGARTTNDGKPEFLNAANILGAQDRTMAYAVSGSGISTSGSGVKDAVEKLGGFVFTVSGSYASATIVGIEIAITGEGGLGGSFTGAAGYYVRAETGSKPGPQLFGEFKAYGTVTHGGPLDTLGVAWVIGDLSTVNTDLTKLIVTVGKTGTGAGQRLGIDSVRVKLYFNANSINLNGPAYRVVTYRDQIGLTVSDPVNLPPPECSTGDFYQGMLVLNDVANESTLRYSLPGKPEAFPKPYELTFTSRRRDRVTFIRSLGSFLFVGMENGIKRVNYLPRETDTDLNVGLAHEDLTTDHGIPGPLCAVKFDMPGHGVMIAYASAAGMFLSSGQWIAPLNLDLDWANTVKLSALSTSVLRVYPKEKWLAFYYCPAGATHNKNTRALYFCYQADKMKDEYQLPVVGPVVVSGRSSCEIFLSGTHYVLTGHESDGKIYVEDSGLTIPSGYQVRLNDDSANGDGKTTAATDVRIIPLIRTRKFYSITLDRDGYGERLYLLFSAYGSNAITATGACTLGSVTVTVSGVSGTIAKGQRVLGTALDAGTIVLNVSGSTVTLSRAANATGSVALTFDTGTLGLTVRGSGQGEVVKGLRTDYISTLAGDLVSVLNSNFRRGFELQIEKVPLTFDSNGDTLTWADLSTNMRLHTITYVVSDQGLPDTNRNSV